MNTETNAIKLPLNTIFIYEIDGVYYLYTLVKKRLYNNIVDLFKPAYFYQLIPEESFLTKEPELETEFKYGDLVEIEGSLFYVKNDAATLNANRFDLFLEPYVDWNLLESKKRDFYYNVKYTLENTFWYSINGVQELYKIVKDQNHLFKCFSKNDNYKIIKNKTEIVKFADPVIEIKKNYIINLYDPYLDIVKYFRIKEISDETEVYELQLEEVSEEELIDKQIEFEKTFEEFSQVLDNFINSPRKEITSNYPVISYGRIRPYLKSVKGCGDNIQDLVTNIFNLINDPDRNIKVEDQCLVFDGNFVFNFDFNSVALKHISGKSQYNWQRTFEKKTMLVDIAQEILMAYQYYKTLI